MKRITLIVLLLLTIITCKSYSAVTRYVLNQNADTQYNVWVEVNGVDVYFPQVNPGADAGAGTSPLAPWSTIDYTLQSFNNNDTIIYFRYNYKDTKTISYKDNTKSLSLFSNFGVITTEKTNINRFWYNSSQNLQGIVLDGLYNYENDWAGGYGFLRANTGRYLYIKDCIDYNAGGNAGGFAFYGDFNNSFISNIFINGGGSSRGAYFNALSNNGVKSNNIFDSVTVSSRGTESYPFFFSEGLVDRNIIINMNRTSASYTPSLMTNYDTPSTNLLYNNFNDNGYLATKISDIPKLLNLNGETYPFNEAYADSVGFDDTGLSFWATYYPYDDEVKAYIINSLKYKSNDFRAKVLARINKVHGVDTTAAIISNDVFNNDTRIAIFFSINYNTATANLTMLSNYFTADSLTIASELLDLDTTFIIYPAQSAVYNDTNYFLLSWENLKGAIGSWKVELATDAAFTTDYDSIVIDVNTSETANTTTYYKQLANKTWYMRVRPYSVKKE